MTVITIPNAPAPPRDLVGQTVVVLGGSSGIGLETARLARAHGADVVVTARNTGRLRAAAEAIDARRAEAFDLTDAGSIERFFEELSGPIDHVLLSGGGPYYSSLAGMDFDRARRDLNDHILVALAVARYAAIRMRMSGSLLFIGGTGARRPGTGMSLPAAVTAAMPPLVANLALELAPIRVNLIAPGFVDTPLSAAILGAQLDARRAALTATLPIGRVVGPRDVASLAMHLMTNTAITGATYDIDGGQQLVAGR